MQTYHTEPTPGQALWLCAEVGRLGGVGGICAKVDKFQEYQFERDKVIPTDDAARLI